MLYIRVFPTISPLFCCLYCYSPAVAQCWCHGNNRSSECEIRIVVYVVFNPYLRLIIVFIVSPIIFIVVQTSAIFRRASSCHWSCPRRIRRAYPSRSSMSITPNVIRVSPRLYTLHFTLYAFHSAVLCTAVIRRVLLCSSCWSCARGYPASLSLLLNPKPLAQSAVH